MVLGRLLVCARPAQPRRARLLHVSAIRLAFAPIDTPVVGSCTSTNGEHVPSSPPVLARKASAKVLSKPLHPDQPAWTEATSIGAAKEFAARVW